MVGALIPAVAWDIYRPVLSERLAKHGFAEGRNLRIERGVMADAAGPGIAREAAQKLLSMQVDALFSCLDWPTMGASWATKSVPVVFTWVSDPVEIGVVESLSRPGGNITGVTSRSAELAVKRLELALELVPHAKRVAFVGLGFWSRYATAMRPGLLEVVKRAEVELLELNFNGSRTIEDAHRAGADVVVTSSNQALLGRRSIVEDWVKTSVDRRLPVVFAGREEVEEGGLISYATNASDDIRRAADLLARVLRGEKPGDLPVEQGSLFELAVNLKTAKALGLTIPPAILLRADRVIE